MPSSSTQAACSSSRSFSHYAEDLAQNVMRLVQALRSVAEAYLVLFAGDCARLIGQMLRSAQSAARTILKKLGRPIQNEENIAVSSPQGAAVLSNPKCRDSPVQLLEGLARGCGHSDASSLSLKICRRIPRITNWERGVLIGKGSFASIFRGYSNEDGFFFAAKGVSLTAHRHLCHLENEIATLKRNLENEINSQSLKLGLGSPLWMAPEVAKLKRVGYGFPSDIWSLGCTVAELSTRKYPRYNADNAVKVDRAIRRGEGPIVPDYLSHTLKDFINQCLQPDPNQRPTASDLLAHPFVDESS